MIRSRAAAGPGAPAKSRPAALRRGMPAGEAFHQLMLAGLAHLQANERGVLDGRDPEHLHQMRVALRRLRSTVEIFGPLLPAAPTARAERGTKWLSARLGPARDWDVLVKETLPAFEREMRARGAGSGIAARCVALRNQANAHARRAVLSIRYRRLKDLLAALAMSGDRPLRLDDTAARAVLLGPVEELATAVLERRYDQARRRGRGLDGLSAHELHRLRIHVKKLRYAASFFSGLYDTKRARDVLTRLARLQDILGAMNDAATASELVARKTGRAGTRRTNEENGNLQNWSRGRAARLRRELKGAWRNVQAAGKYW